MTGKGGVKGGVKGSQGEWEKWRGVKGSEGKGIKGSEGEWEKGGSKGSRSEDK